MVWALSEHRTFLQGKGPTLSHCVWVVGTHFFDSVSHCNSSLQGLSENPSYANVVFLKVDVDDAQVSFLFTFLIDLFFVRL